MLDTPAAFGRAWNLGGAGVTTQLELMRMAFGGPPRYLAAGKTIKTDQHSRFVNFLAQFRFDRSAHSHDPFIFHPLQNCVQQSAIPAVSQSVEVQPNIVSVVPFANLEKQRINHRFWGMLISQTGQVPMWVTLLFDINAG